jgi:hypothetical protein
MKKLLETLLGIFKSKNIDLSAEEQAALFQQMLDSQESTLPDIAIPENLKHNEKFIRDMQAAYRQETEVREKKWEQQNAALLAKNDELMKMISEEQTKRAEGAKALEEQAAKDRAAKIETLIAEAVKAEKIPANNDALKTTYKSMLEKDYDLTKTIIDGIPGKTSADPAPVDTIAAGSPAKHTELASIVNPQIMARLDTQKAFN